MDPEIITWFYDRGFHINKLIQNCKPGVRPTQVKAAMVQLYNNYDGKNIGLGHKVQELAAGMRDEELIEQELDLAKAHENAKYHKRRHDTMKNWFIGSIVMWVWLSTLLIVHFANKGF